MTVKVKLLDSQTSSIEVSSEIFDRQFNEPLVHQVMVAYQAAARSGTRTQKNRSAVSGGGAKPWRQKGMGRARAGTSRGPIWRGGGVTFAAQPKNYSQKVNRKMYRGAMRSILSELLRQERLLVVEKFNLERAKTKALLSILKGFDIKDGLIVKKTLDEDLYLSARNLPRVDVCDVIALDPVSLISYEKVVMTVNAVKQIEQVLV